MSDILEALGKDGIAILSGIGVQLLTSFARMTFMRSAWDRWGWAARVVAVAVMAAVFAGLAGYAAGLTGWALVTHIIAAFVAALGTRQLVKRWTRMLGPPGPIELSRDEDFASIRTRPPEPPR